MDQVQMDSAQRNVVTWCCILKNRARKLPQYHCSLSLLLHHVRLFAWGNATNYGVRHDIEFDGVTCLKTTALPRKSFARLCTTVPVQKLTHNAVLKG
eukprot:3780654-Amphidinium_carterae.1